MTRMAADYPAWPSSLKPGMNLITMCLRLVARLVFGCHTGSPWSSCRVCFKMLRFCPEAQGIWRFQLIFVGTEQLVPWLHSIVHCSKLPYIVHCQWWTLFSVFWHFWSTPHATPQLLRLRVCCAKLVTLSDHMEHSSRGDLHLLFSFIFLACRNCPRGAIQAQEEVLDPCCEPYAQPSPSLTFFSLI